MYARLRLVVLVLITLFIPSTGSAQQANAPAATTGPTIDAVVTGFRTPTASADSTAVPLQTRRERQSIALMIVGGAAVVLGAVIGDDVGTLFMIGGAVALLIGLYKYLS